MKKTIGVYEFIDEFRDSQYKNNFSYEGLKALYEYFEEYEEVEGIEIELDIVAIACDWTEYDNFEGIKEYYEDIETMEDLENITSVIEASNGHLIIMDC